MLRSQILSLIRILHCQNANLSKELGTRSCAVLDGRLRLTCARHFSLSKTSRKDDDQSPKIPTKIENESLQKTQSEGIPIDDNLRTAATDAAKALPGDWNKTLETLLERLSDHKVDAQDSSSIENQPASSDKPVNSLLETLVIKKAGFKRGDFTNQDSRSRGEDENSFGPKSGGRKQERKHYKELFEVPRLGIFNADKVKSQIGQRPTVLGKGLWEEEDAKHVRFAQGGIPRNAWEEQIEWTKQRKLWAFPIDNEADMHEERKYKFHEHVFLERHLGNDFPSTGPIRKFMSLVCLGLSQSPWLTVPEKVEHIRWFVGYFREKQALLEATIPGGEGKMPDTGDKRVIE